MSDKVTTVDEQIELWPLDKIIPYEKNAKIHDEEKIATLAEKIRKNGFQDPIKIDEHGVIIGGHCRRLAAIKAGLTQVRVLVLRGLSEEQKQELRIFDNKIAARGGYDENLLNAQILELTHSDISLGDLGFSQEEADTWLKTFGDLNTNLKLDDAPAADTAKTEPEKTPAKVPTIDEIRARDKEYKPTYQIVVMCKDEDDQRAVYERITQDGYECRVQTI
jgi:hypothetical protein